jgi:hypothetical protein
MSIVSEQAVFLNEVCKLIDFIHSENIIVTGGELYRTKEQQDIYIKSGRSKTNNSMHMKRLAIDLNFFKIVDGVPVLINEKSMLQSIGDFWESLDSKNRWGGNFNGFEDCPHFERGIV